MFVALALLGGCASRGNLEVLESALRVQEDQLADLRQQLSTTNNELQVSQNEISRLREQLAGAGQQAHAPEHLENEYKAVGLRFNSYLTSGIDRDGQPGDEKLSVLLYPHDDQGGLVKLPGTIELRALDLSAPEGQQVVGNWTFTPAETKAAWHSGFLAAGFLFEEPWQRQPLGADVTLHARFKMIDGRQFDAVQPLKVNPATDRQAPSTVSLQRPAVELELAEPLGAPLEDEDPAGVIETSDRYRESEIPVIR